MKKIILIFAFFIAFQMSNAQMVNYRVDNRTDQLSPLKVGLTLVGVENFLTPITAGVSVDYRLIDHLTLNGQVRIGYLKNFLLNESALVTTQPENTGFYSEITGNYAFLDWTSKGKIKVQTSGSTYFKAQCDARHQIAGTAGVFDYSRSGVEYCNSTNYIISGTTNLIPSNPDQNMFLLSKNTFGGVFGLTYSNIKKCIVHYNDVSQTKYLMNRLYFHLLAGGTGVGKITYNGSDYKIDNAKNLQPIGYKLGWYVEEGIMTAGLEFGLMPDIYFQTPQQPSVTADKYPNYFKFTFGLMLYGSDSKFGMK